jgi:hypothetical protein
MGVSVVTLNEVKGAMPGHAPFAEFTLGEARAQDDDP